MKEKSGFQGPCIDFKSDNIYDIGYGVNLLASRVTPMVQYTKEEKENAIKDDWDPGIYMMYNSARLPESNNKIVFLTIDSIKIEHGLFKINGHIKHHENHNLIGDEYYHAISLEQIKSIRYFEQKLYFSSSEIDEPHLITAELIMKNGSFIDITVCINWSVEGEDYFI